MMSIRNQGVSSSKCFPLNSVISHCRQSDRKIPCTPDLAAFHDRIKASTLLAKSRHMDLTVFSTQKNKINLLKREKALEKQYAEFRLRFWLKSLACK